MEKQLFKGLYRGPRAAEIEPVMRCGLCGAKLGMVLMHPRMMKKERWLLDTSSKRT